MKIDISGYGEQENGERKIEVSFIDEDFWNLDNTLATVIAPSLAKFIERMKNDSVAAGFPHALGSLEKWIEMLEKMHWSFNEIAEGRPGEDEFFNVQLESRKDEFAVYHLRIQEGCELFGKYFQHLWE